jgi:hypothetical protein
MMRAMMELVLRRRIVVELVKVCLLLFSTIATELTHGVFAGNGSTIVSTFEILYERDAAMLAGAPLVTDCTATSPLRHDRFPRTCSFTQNVRFPPHRAMIVLQLPAVNLLGCLHVLSTFTLVSLPNTKTSLPLLRSRSIPTSRHPIQSPFHHKCLAPPILPSVAAPGIFPPSPQRPAILA